MNGKKVKTKVCIRCGLEVPDFMTRFNGSRCVSSYYFVRDFDVIFMPHQWKIRKNSTK